MSALVEHPPVDQLLRPIVLVELLDDLTRRLTTAASWRAARCQRERGRLFTERAWVEMCLRDRHPRMTPPWRAWDERMRLDVAAAQEIADRLEGR